MLRKSWLVALAGVVLISGTALAGTFGRVVAIGGAASDVALDEARGRLYIANFTANRVEVLSLATNTIQTSINVAAQPSSISLSPDGHWLLVAHYGNRETPASSTNGLTLIDLTANNAKQTFALSNPPLGVAFGIDNKALIVTTAEFILFDPVVGSSVALTTFQAQAAKTIPQPANQAFPANVVTASVAASADGLWIYGFGDTLQFRYNVATKGIASSFYTASPALAPRAIAVADDGAYAAIGWTMVNQQGQFYAEFPSPTGELERGGHAIDSKRGLVYSEVPTSADTFPAMTVRDADNLTLRETLRLPEDLAGKGILSSDGNTMYAASASGVLILPVGTLNSVPRVAPSVEDLVFRGNFCDRNVATKTFVLADPGGARVPFTISSDNSGVSVSPSSGTTPAVITVRVDPNSFSPQKGTVAVTLTIASSTAVNVPAPIRVLVNSREPDQRGTFIDIPGTLVDLVSNPTKDEYYVLRQDKNQVLVFDGTNNTQKATMRTCTKPMSMTVTYDRRQLLVGCDNSHMISVFDLETYQPSFPIYSPSSYVQSIASSAKATLALVRDGGGGRPLIEIIDIPTRTAVRPPALGVYENDNFLLDTVLASSPNGSSILIVSSDGSLMLYDANVNSFTVSRKESSGLAGSYAVSAFGQYQVGDKIFNSSLVPVATLQSISGKSSGFAFVDQGGLFVSAPDAGSPGVIERVDTELGTGIRPTRTVEAPLLGSTTHSFTHTLAPLYSRTGIVLLTTSGVTALPWNYDASVAPPQISRVASAADGVSSSAPGGLISLFGSQLSPTNIATQEIPVPTALGDSCLTVNGDPIPVIFVSPSQINAQMPFQALGNVTLVVHTPGGVSDNYNLTVQPAAPAIFRSGVAGPEVDLPTVVRADNNLLITPSNPVRQSGVIVIYLTGMGPTNPAVDTGAAAPMDPLAVTVTAPDVRIGGVPLSVEYSGLAPGLVGVYQINARVPSNAPQGLSVPLTIVQGTASHTINVRVVQQ